MRIAGKMFAFALVAHLCPVGPARADVTLSIEPQAVMELLPLVADALDIYARAGEREAKHVAELRRKGIAEVPACGSERYVIDLPSFGGFSFDGWGEVYIDRRFVTDEEMKTVKKIEAWIAKWFPRQTAKRVKKPRRTAGGAGLPVFRGFEDPRSKAAWAVDPLQVNVPGDWGEEKTLVGLSKPKKRNEGTAEQNVRAAIKYLSRKGFGTSARPASVRPNGVFDGWKSALRRYNGRRDRTDTDRYYSDEYADKILRRAKNPDLFVPIEIKLAK